MFSNEGTPQMRDEQVTFASRKPLDNSNMDLNPERIKFFMSLFANAPELTLEEIDHIRTNYMEIMHEKETANSTLDLRILLGRLGLYPEEEELQLLLAANRDRVNFTALCHYLRFYKKEYELADKQEREEARQAQLPPAQQRFGGGAVGKEDWRAFNNHAQLGDSDTLRAFVALGGNEDGSGEVSTTVLTETIHHFDLAIDVAAMIQAVDVHRAGVLDYNDFCTMWALPEEQVRRGSVASFSSLNEASRRPTMEPQTGPPSLWPKELLTVLATSTTAGVSGGRVQTAESTAPSAPPPVAAVRTEQVTAPSDEEHLLLLRLYLYPEQRVEYEQVHAAPPPRKTRFTEGTRRASSMTNNFLLSRQSRLSTTNRNGASRSSLQGATAAVMAASALKKKKKAHEPLSAEDYLAARNNGYHPPSPMILSLRNSTRYKKKEDEAGKGGSAMGKTTTAAGGVAADRPYASTANPRNSYNNVSMNNSTVTPNHNRTVGGGGGGSPSKAGKKPGSAKSNNKLSTI